jgi:hypothetical protein
MSINYSRMIVVASGGKAQTQRWGKALGAASIVFSAVQPCSNGNTSPSQFWELWVQDEDADEARAAIRAVTHREEYSLW